ncbi:MAG: hypothetical protein WAO20_21205 [Acidobacteriota bacterium]
MRGLLGLAILLLTALVPAACTTTPPQGEPIDMEALRTFAPFDLKGLDGQQHRLRDYLDKITLVSFFFPT